MHVRAEHSQRHNRIEAGSALWMTDQLVRQF
jgi:hypothetical protein